MHTRLIFVFCIFDVFALFECEYSDEGNIGGNVGSIGDSQPIPKIPRLKESSFNRTSTTRLDLSYKTISVGSDGQCCAVCTFEDRCNAVSVHATDGTCKLIDRSMSTYPPEYVSSDPDWSTLVKVCEPNWEEYHGSCYKLTAVERTWEDGEKECQTMGGHLVTINDYGEKSFVEYQFSEPYWIGLNDIETEDEFVWVSDGSGLTIDRTTAFGAQQPYSASDFTDCTQTTQSLGYWDTSPCSDSLKCLCEKSL